jgi:hypothetical protein
MVPHVEPLQPAPEIVQLTAVFAVPVTVALNCCWAPITSFAEVGVTETATPLTTVTVAVADFVVFAFEVAVTITVAGLGIVVGAV